MTPIGALKRVWFPPQETVSDMAQLVVTQIRSAIGAKPKQRGTLRALGLGRIGRTNTLPDRSEIRGMIARVPHLVEVRTMENEGGD